MSLPIEDYAMIGDTHTAAVVGRNGSIDWLCLPRFDSGACFAALLGTEDHGRWLMAPKEPPREVRRSYRGDSLVLDTEFVTSQGRVRVTDCMPIRERHPQVVRLVEGLEGQVDMHMSLVIRFDYGSIVPWARRQDGLMTYIGGPDALYLWSQVETRGQAMTTVADFTVGPGQVRSFQLSWHQSHERPPRPVDARYCVEETERLWRSWVGHCQYRGRWREAVARSLVTLKALTYQPTGGIVAAATTSLPEDLGGERNWDYRYCWLRDSTFTLSALMEAGYLEEARAWRQWLLRAVAGDPEDLQIMYGPAGERRLDERELEWLPGYEGSTPVRVGNAAAGQYQLDVYGEVMSSLHEARERGLIRQRDPAWALQKALLEFLVEGWKEPDDGIWEVRGGRRHFTHSKVMAWVAFDRAVAAAERWGLDGPVDTWRRTRDQIRQEVLAKGYDQDKGAFTQYYGSGTLDASLLVLPHVGFLEATDPRMRSTVEAIQKELVRDGFVLRYQPEGPEGVDGLKGEEGAFLPCSFWLVDNLALLGRLDEAQELFERLLGLRNDLGLLSEEYDPRHSRLVGNFPQAFSHVSLVNSAVLLDQLLEQAESS